ncbi:endonuclease/exonuclease/phosphatase family protein [Mycolicibacterium phlei]
MARRVGTTLAVLAFVIGAAGLAVRFVPIVNRPLIAAAALAPYLILGAPAAVIGFVLLRRWWAALFAVALTAVVIATQAPLYTRDGEPAGARIRVASVNLRYGQADPAAVATMARRNVHVLAVQELTPQLEHALNDALAEDFPYRQVRPKEGPAGVGLWSRYPLTDPQTHDEFWLGLVTARAHIPHTNTATTVATTHLSPPWPDPFDGWRTDMANLANTLQDIAARSPGPVIVAGDFNATTDMREFRRLLGDNYRDAAEQAGAGLTRTHPADLAIPPVFAVDHILIRGATATSVTTLPVDGSDHRALVATIVLPN